MNLLIPGGAGYIGSHMVRYAQSFGHEVVVLDDFSTGHNWSIKDCEVIEINLLDYEKMRSLLHGRKFDGIIHFAAKSLVGESVKYPHLYYRNNVAGTINLLDIMLENENLNIVFSSTAAIFGNPVTKKISEDHPKNPINPYGQTKLMTEEILREYCNAYNFNACCLRYFNAAGAHETGDIGEAHEEETHLIPNVLKSLKPEGNNLKVFGDDYATQDGTCIRDYVHVDDLAQAHLLAMKHMKTCSGFSEFNLGIGNGFSVKDVIKNSEEVTGMKITYEIHEKRPGDPEILVADSQKAEKILEWKPQHTSLDTIISSAWNWHGFNEEKVLNRDKGNLDGIY